MNFKDFKIEDVEKKDIKDFAKMTIEMGNQIDKLIEIIFDLMHQKHVSDYEMIKDVDIN